MGIDGADKIVLKLFVWGFMTGRFCESKQLKRRKDYCGNMMLRKEVLKDNRMLQIGKKRGSVDVLSKDVAAPLVRPVRWDQEENAWEKTDPPTEAGAVCNCSPVMERRSV